MKFIHFLFSTMLLNYICLASPSKAIVVTVDGLNLSKVLLEIWDDSKDAAKGITTDLGERCNLEAQTNLQTYLEPAIHSMGLGRDIEILPYQWMKDPQCSLPEVEKLKKFIIQSYTKAYDSHKKFIIVAHSWGTVLVYAALQNIQLDGSGVDLLITLGSPLGAESMNSKEQLLELVTLPRGGLPVIDELFVGAANAYIPEKFKELNITREHCNLPIQRWINYWNWGDAFSGPVKKRCPMAEDRTMLMDNANWAGKLAVVFIRRGPLSTAFWHGFNSLMDYNSFLKCPTHNQNLKIEVAEAIRTTYAAPIADDRSKKDGILLGLILDSSGSMAENDSQDARKNAAEIIANRLSGREKVFLVDFDDRAVWLNPSAWSTWTTSDLADCIKKVDSYGNTNVMGGLRTMRDAIQSSGADAPSKGVLLLTDGLDNASIDTELIAWYRDQHIPLYTISLAGEENAALLNEIASGTSGRYEKARSADDIVDIFNRIYAHLSGNAVLSSTSVPMKTGDTYSKDFFVDNSLTDLSTIVSYRGSEARLTLRTPHGKRIMQNDPGAEWTVGHNYVIAKISKPEKGRWSAEVKATSMPPEGEPVTLALQGMSNVNWDLEPSLVHGMGISFAIRPQNGMENVSISRMNAALTEPDGTVRDITPMLKGSQLGPIPVFKKGSYTANISLTGIIDGRDSVQRQLTAAAIVGDSVLLNAWSVIKADGMFISSNITDIYGARTGVYCNIYSKSSPGSLIAKGIISFVNNERCDIELRNIYHSTPRVGDIVVFEPQSFSADHQ